MRGSGELLDNLRTLIERWLQRVEVIEAQVGFAPASEAAVLVPEVEGHALDLTPPCGASVAETLGLAPDLEAVPIPSAGDHPSNADGVAFPLGPSASEALEAPLAEVIEIPAALAEARCAALDARLPGLESTHAVAASLPPVRSHAVGRTTLPPARSFRHAAEFGRPRTTRDDGCASSQPLVRLRTEGPLGVRAASRAMRALVETSGLPASSLEWIGVYDRVPASPPSRLTVDADGKRIRLWYPEGARATGIHRIAAARIRGSGRVHAAVVAPE